MIDELPDVPPALLLLLQALPGSSSVQDMRRRIKGMLHELRDQSEVFLGEHAARRTDSYDPMQFNIHLHGDMNLLSGSGCQNLRCRIGTARRISRSVGLLADTIWITDLLTEKFINFGRPTKSKLDRIIDDILVLAELLPFILAGIIKFRSPWVSSCSSCLEFFENHVESASEELASIFETEFKIINNGRGNVSADTGRCFEPSLIVSFNSKRANKLPSQKEIAQIWVHRELRSALWIAREAAMTGGAVFSNSRVGLAGLLQQDGRFVDVNTLLMLDSEREISVPWVNKLSPDQVIQLREEASTALPIFREKLSQAMAVKNHDKLSKSDTTNIIGELREQAVEVREELESKRRHSARYWKTTYGILGFGLSAYGLANNEVTPAIGGLLPIIHLLINHKSGHEAEISELTRKPGYVLVKAQDILAHSHESSS